MLGSTRHYVRYGASIVKYSDELQSNRSNVTNCYENLFYLQDYTYVKLDRLDELEITKFGNMKPGSLFFEAYVGKVMYAKESKSRLTSKLTFDACFSCSDMKKLTGKASCRICQQNFSATVTGINIYFYFWYIKIYFYLKVKKIC
ncbi:hypothetical protein Hanom_Chr13g01219841 [Helianthus anomalus]